MNDHQLLCFLTVSRTLNFTTAARELYCTQPALSYQGGFIAVPEKPGLGIDELNEKLIKEKACPDFPPPWAPTEEWDREWSNDRRWS